jgi:hypothetical protein
VGVCEEMFKVPNPRHHRRILHLNKISLKRNVIDPREKVTVYDRVKRTLESTLRLKLK